MGRRTRFRSGHQTAARFRFRGRAASRRGAAARPRAAPGGRARRRSRSGRRAGHRRPVQRVDRRRRAAACRRAASGGSARAAPARRCRAPAARAASARSSSVAMSRRLMFRPWAPIGGTTCAASATSAVRGPSSRSATWETIGQSRRGAGEPQPSEQAAAPRVGGLGEGVVRQRRRAPPPAVRVSIQTTAECGAPSRSGSGTRVNGPPERWISVETPSCGSVVGDGEDQRLLAVAPAPRADPEPRRTALSRPSAAITSARPRPAPPPDSATIAPAVRGVTRSTRTPARSSADGSSASRATISRRSSQFGRFQPKISAPVSSATKSAVARTPALGAAGVDDAHDPERRGVGREPRPEAGAVEQRQRRHQEGGRAQVRALGLGRGRPAAPDRRRARGTRRWRRRPRRSARRRRRRRPARRPRRARSRRRARGRRRGRRSGGGRADGCAAGPTSTVRIPSRCGTSRLRWSSSNIAARGGVEPVEREDRGEGRRLGLRHVGRVLEAVERVEAALEPDRPRSPGARARASRWCRRPCGRQPAERRRRAPGPAAPPSGRCRARARGRGSGSSPCSRISPASVVP